jgi:hypothetical protein
MKKSMAILSGPRALFTPLKREHSQFPQQKELINGMHKIARSKKVLIKTSCTPSKSLVPSM